MAGLWYLSYLGHAGAESPASGSLRLEITHGQVSTDDDAVVALYHGTALSCTGTLIGPRVVLTASHCLSGQGPDWVVFEIGPQATPLTLGVSGVIRHPRYDPLSLANDIGLVVLDAAMEQVRPVQLLLAGGELREGMDVRIVGYGASETPGAEPARRFAKVKIGHVAASSFDLEMGDAQPCHGDSGGPAFIEVNGHEYLAGVHSRGDEECLERATEIRTDVHHDEFVMPWMAQVAEAGKPAGARCWYDGNCESNVCWPGDTDGWPLCSAVCSNDDGCPEWMRCDGDRCVSDTMAPGRLGTPCTDGNDCTSGLCARQSTTSPFVCAERCFIENEYPCEEGFVCAVNVDRPSRRACFEQPPRGQAGCNFSAHEQSQFWGVIAALWILRRRKG